jgi:hypothetical protein
VEFSRALMAVLPALIFNLQSEIANLKYSKVLSSKSLLLKRVSIHVVAVLFPESGSIVIDEF